MKKTDWIIGKIVLESGEEFIGKIPAWQKDQYFGEFVFTTGMSGYTESLTDPSFAGQILTFTYPLIGNYGVPEEALYESKKIHARGVVVSTAIENFSHHQAKLGLVDWLKSQNVPLIAEIDTRRLTKVLRSKGVARGVIMSAEAAVPKKFPDPNLEHLVKEVARKKVESVGAGSYKIIAVDCGMKENILRNLTGFPIEVKVVPFDYDFSLDEFDGLFLSNGPGDPERCVETIANLQKVLDRNKPIFGICLGAQILGLAIGAKTYKLPFGHRGQNQPCIELTTQRAVLTSQNHGYAVDEKTLPEDWIVTYKHLNDDTVAGIAHKTLPYFAVQFHPEAAPGPRDTTFLFEQFYEAITNAPKESKKALTKKAVSSEIKSGGEQTDIFGLEGRLQ